MMTSLHAPPSSPAGCSSSSDGFPVRGVLSLPAGLSCPSWALRILALLLLAGSLLSLPAWGRAFRLLLDSGTYSDVSRQWYCCLYVRNGVDPFRAANDALVRTYGPVQGPDRIRLKKVRIFSVNMTQYDEHTPGLLPGTPPPEAGYAPSSLAICLALFGFLPEHMLNAYWLGINLLCLLELIWFFGSPENPASPRRVLLSLLFCASILLIWPTTRLVFAHGQFTFFSLLCALLGLQHRIRRPWLASVFFSLSLIKPALVLLFLIIPFLERNWRLLTGVALFHGLTTLLIAAMVHATPWALLSDWMNICRYLLQGGYTFQEIFNALEWENTWIATAITLAFFAYCTGVCWLRRSRQSWILVTFLCFANLLWTYHERHDFTLLAIPCAFGILQWLSAPPTPRSHLRWGSWLGLFVLMGIGLSTAAYADQLPFSHLMRWAGRIGIWTAFLWVNVEIWKDWIQSRGATMARGSSEN